MKRLKSDGFTIVELMIATAVFSIVLLTISAAIIQIGRLYHKGITSAHTQQVARTIMDNIGQTIQFTAGQIVASDLDNVDDSSINGMCIGTYHYSYKIGQQRLDDKHALVMRDTLTNCGGMTAQELTGSVDGKELLSERMRLSKFSVTQSPTSPTTYTITVGVIYGDDDILCIRGETAGPHSCISPESMTASDIRIAVRSGGQLACKNIRAGSEFCAASELSTIVERRLQQ